MRIASITRKELVSYFNSPIAYIVVSVFLVASSAWLFLFQQFFARNEATLRAYFASIPAIMIFLVPAITMRSWAEERKSGTLELLLTLPYREVETVFGKFLGAFVLFLLMTVLTIPLPLSLARFGSFDAGQIFGEYLGVILVGSCGISLGLLISSLSANQISSFIFTGLALVILTLASALSGIWTLPGWLNAVVSITFGPHYDSFTKGILDSRDIAYYLLAVVLFLFLNTQVLIRRKWS
jgi:ABC-2 type transport system permease protein